MAILDTKDEAHALEQVAARLKARLPHVEEATIERYVQAAYHEFDGAPIRDFVEILTERGAMEKFEEQVA
ncbi:MAG: three-helix bundle dimerization domain-containing protein [Marmoricola sp.]